MNMDTDQIGGASTIDDASMHTITASSLQNPSYDHRPTTSYSDTGFSRSYNGQPSANTPDRDVMMGGDPQNGAGISRPASGAAGSQYGEQRQNAQKNSSVVIKVGMVGDAQIGKTSLMVKYVEGSWDEDYIQTLGKQALCANIWHGLTGQASTSWKRQSQFAIQKSPSRSGI